MMKSRIRRVIQRYNDNKNSTKRLLKWTGIAIGIGILFVFMLPIIILLAAVVGILILISFLYKKRKSSNSNKPIGIGIFDLISSIIFSGLWKNSIKQNNYYYYYCVSCGTKHREVTCPRCGSKFRKKVNA